MALETTYVTNEREFFIHGKVIKAQGGTFMTMEKCKCVHVRN